MILKLIVNSKSGAQTQFSRNQSCSSKLQQIVLDVLDPECDLF